MSTYWLEGNAYIQIRSDGWKLRCIKATQRVPRIVEPGCVVVKVRIRIPETAFAPLQPQAVITVPEELVQRAIEVEAVNPS